MTALDRNHVKDGRAMTHPETRASLLMRVRDRNDHEAWYEFEEIYRPVIYRIAMFKGLQSADAEDLAQRVMLSVSGAIDRFQPQGPAKFRTCEGAVPLSLIHI